jgi:hypothetical protein
MPTSPRRRKSKTEPPIDDQPEAPPPISVSSETRSLAALKPYPNNPRTHSDTQIEQVCRSMLEFGAWTAPCVIDEDDVVLAGHGRRLAALRLVERGHARFAEDVPVRVVRGWSAAQKRAYVIADNSIADNAGWDTNLLRLEIGELQAIDFGTEVLGFSQQQWTELFPSEDPAAARAAASAGTLLDRFMVAPFSVLNAREGWWQARKKAWIGLGLKSELGRGENALDMSAAMAGLTDPEEIEAWNERRRLNHASPGGSAMPLDRARAAAANTPSLGKGQAAGLVALRAAQKEERRRVAIGAEPLDAADKRLSGQSGGDRMLRAAPGRGASTVTGAWADPGYIRKNNARKANAEPAGGGGGGWKATNDKLAENRARLQAGLPPPPKGLAIGTQDWAQRKIAEGDIAGGMASGNSGTSIFDPVLCEVAYRWFSPPGGLVLDPFAGGSVRGIVASKLGRRYVGVDLRAEQVAANVEQGQALCEPDAQPEWHVGDSSVVLAGDKAPGRGADFLFSCPPYGDLERYSDLADDLSTMDHGRFLELYDEIIKHAVALLAPDRFACFVVGDFRDQRTGFYRDFVSSTIDAFENAGARLYNEIILVTSAGSLPIRAGKQFSTSRKVGKTHQNVLVFCKGDPLKR